MKRIIAMLLAALLLLGTLPAALAAAPVQTVLAEGNDFSFNSGSGWGTKGHWTNGRSAEEGLWAQSGATDGRTAAAYIGKRLTGTWSFNAQLTPLSTKNSDGRAVSRVQLLDQYKNPKVIFTYEYLAKTKQTALKWEAISSATTGSWNELLRLDWSALEDTALNLTFTKTGLTQITLTITGNRGYRKTARATLPQDVMQALCYAGLAAERTTARFSNVRLSFSLPQSDYTAAAETAYENLMKNFLIAEEDRLRPVVYGMVSGDKTNTGYTISVSRAGDLWEAAVALMAMDTYAQYHAQDTEAYRKTALRIANTVNYFLQVDTEAELTTPGTAPVNHAMDDCGWNVMAFLLGYRYNLVLGRTGDAAVCLRYAEKLFNNSFAHYYDDALGGGMWYNDSRAEKSLYAATLALAGLELYDLTSDEALRERAVKIYEGVENNLRRADGLYSMSISTGGVEGADNPYDISEGCSCTSLAGNMCMAVVNARLGNTEKARITTEGIALFETTRTGGLLNDRDAWNNTFFLGYFLRELMRKNVADARYQDILRVTASSILKNAVFSDGYYSAAWEGPKEPKSNGYPTDYPTEQRNRWGTQVNQDGIFVGSTPNQIMTTATTIHVLFAVAAMTGQPAAAELRGLQVEDKTLWPVFNPEITSYTLLGTDEKKPLRLAWQAADGLTVALNGAAQEESAATLEATVNKAVLTVTAADGGSTRAYTVTIREGCDHRETETVTTPASCTHNGSAKLVCKLCGATLETTVLPATGHRHTRTDTIPAACLAVGRVTVVCTDCGATVSVQTLPALGHGYANGVCVRCGAKEPAQTCNGGASCPSRAFSDLATDGWYHRGVDDCLNNGLMNGVSGSSFDPDGGVTRAMLVTILYRMEGKPSTAGGSNPFADVPAGAWYTDAVVWAADQGIVNGVSATQFAPDASITREQIAAILFRYAKAAAPGQNVLGTFPDVGSVSAYAREAMSWAVEQALINGMDGRLAPTQGATRAQIATILARYIGNAGA